MLASEVFLCAGYRQTAVPVLPMQQLKLYYSLVPVSVGHLDLPRIALKWKSQGREISCSGVRMLLSTFSLCLHQPGCWTCPCTALTGRNKDRGWSLAACYFAPACRIFFACWVSASIRMYEFPLAKPQACSHVPMFLVLLCPEVTTSTQLLLCKDLSSRANASAVACPDSVFMHMNAAPATKIFVRPALHEGNAE